MQDEKQISLLKEKIISVHSLLLGKFGISEFLEEYSPIDELVSTFLSQNTNDTNRDRAFDAIKSTYKSWEEVLDADPMEFQKTIRVAGLANQKGPNIQNALRRILYERGCLELDFLKDLSIEEARQWLLDLKGVGYKTAAIVLLFSLDMPAFPVDTHVYRVSGRIGLRPADMNIEKTHRYFEEMAPQNIYKPLHLNLIRLGREICHARKPSCWLCPLKNICDFEEKNLNPE